MSKNQHRRSSFYVKKINSRPLKITILILTEGRRTEPQYFRECCQSLRLSTVNINKDESGGICIDSKKGPTPNKLLDEVRKQVKQKFYDEIYCVFDKDMHPCYNKVVAELEKLNKKHYKEARNKKKKILIKAITSDICFERWFLLHFIYSSKIYSNADKLIEDLKKHPGFNHYEKGQMGIYSLLKDRLSQAKSRAKKLNSENIDGASTKVVELIERLEKLSAE